MSREPQLRRALERVEAPDESGAETRGWKVVRAAHAERTPLRPGRRARSLTLLAATGALALGIGLSPAGAKVGDLVEEFGEAMGIGAEDSRPALRSLPAAGELLVESEQGVWLVREDGSKRLLGEFEQATWSPHGLFVAAADERQLVALDPAGEVRWTIAAPQPVSDPRWAPSGFRIAYRSGEQLRVVAGDSTGDRVVASGVAPVAPAWRPLDPESKLAAAPGGVGTHVLSYVDEAKNIRTIDADSGETVATTRADLEQLSAAPRAGAATRAISPDGSRLATLQRLGRRDQLLVSPGRGEPGRVLFSARGTLTGPTWSPDGRWLLVGWPAADQWLLISARDRDRVVAFDRISEQFDPGGTGSGRFPRVSGWILPQR